MEETVQAVQLANVIAQERREALAEHLQTDLQSYDRAIRIVGHWLDARELQIRERLASMIGGGPDQVGDAYDRLLTQMLDRITEYLCSISEKLGPEWHTHVALLMCVASLEVLKSEVPMISESLFLMEQGE